MVDSGAVGEIRAFVGTFSVATKPGTWTGIFRAESGGGALMYCGVYPLSLACLVMSPVIEAHTVAAFGETGGGRGYERHLSSQERYLDYSNQSPDECGE